MRKVFLLTLLAALLFSSAGAGTAAAAEGGSGLYLLGYRVLLPGIMPSPGIWLRNDFYWYNASTKAVVIEDEINLNADLRAFLDLITVSAVLPTEKTLGADYGMALIIPVATATITGSVEVPGTGIIDEGMSRTSGGGDIFFTPLSLGWHWENLHCIAALSMFFPAGEYQKNKDVTIGKNRFALDPNIAFTWLDPKRGHELSAALGYTMNQPNRTTNYRSGDELHLDFTLAQHLASGVAFGAGGYYYQQLTADSGNGAVLGPSKGRVLALGPVVSYDTKVRGKTVSLSFKYFCEFADRERWAGNAFFFTAVLEI